MEASGRRAYNRRVSVPLALLLSLALHAALVVAPHVLVAKTAPVRVPGIEVRLRPAPAVAEASAVTTDPEPAPAAPTAVVRPLTGSALRRAQAAFSEHLFYPPQAVAQGLEGEVILLLMLGEDGRLQSASIARSSGHALLDRAALDAARQLGALPGNPRQTLFPVNFRLQ